MVEFKDIDWSNPKSKISDHFTVHDVCYLPTWGRLTNKDELNFNSMCALFNLFNIWMANVRELLSVPLIVHVAYRTPDYNKLVGGSIDSAHIARLEDDVYIAACDFHPALSYDVVIACQMGKKLLMPHLDSLNLRMEDNGDLAGWIHLDNKPIIPGHNRFFKP